MSLEVKQLVIKSNIKSGAQDKESSNENSSSISSCEIEELKSELLNQFRKMIIEQLRKSKER